jgi:phosphoglycerol transferase MdoB-like AlkP superfamily enzyme
MLLIAGILFIPIRGGITTSTANVGMVYFSNNQFLNHAAINPCFSLMASLSKQQDFASQFDFFPEEEKEKILFDLLKAEGYPQDTLLNQNRPNILIVLMESFSANAIEVLRRESQGDTITPHFNRLSQEGILFTNMYANSFRTDRGIVATLNGYLAQPTTSIMKYPAKSQTLPSIAKSLTTHGYVADMLYGGDINFTNMQSYFFSSGYSRITADRNFPISSRLSKWGVNDDLTFQFLYEDIKKRDNQKPWY